jgi:hypothetical protein
MVDDPMVDEPAELLDEPSRPVDEPMRDVEEPKDLTVDPDQQDFAQVREEEDLGYVVKKSKKDKGRKRRKSGALIAPSEGVNGYWNSFLRRPSRLPRE